MWFSQKLKKAVVYTCAITCTIIALNRKSIPYEGESCYWILLQDSSGFWFFYFIQVKCIQKKFIDNEYMIDKSFFVCLFLVITNYILTVLTFESVKHAVIKACNNKIEQGEHNVLFYVCVCSYLSGKKTLHHFSCEFPMPNPPWGNHGS